MRLTLLVVLCVASLAPAQDLVVLGTGARLEGRITSESEVGVTLSMSGGTMVIERSRIASITRAPAPAGEHVVSAKETKVDVLAALNRWPDAVEWFLLERGGAPIGWRVRTSFREVKEGTPCYGLRDHLVIPATVGSTEVDTEITEWVDASFQPHAFAAKEISGNSVRTLSARRADGGFEVLERGQGFETRRQLPLAKSAGFPSFSLRDLEGRGEPSPEPQLLLDARRGELRTGAWSVERAAADASARPSTWTLRSPSGDRVLTRVMGPTGDCMLESWADGDLVARRTTKAEVDATLRGGFSRPQALTRHSVSGGGWSLDLGAASFMAVPSASGSLACFWNADSETSIECFKIDGFTKAEILLSDVATRLALVEPGVQTLAPKAVRHGSFEGFAMEVTATRRGRRIHTYVFATVGPRCPMVFLVASPERGVMAEAPLWLSTLALSY